MPKGQSEAVNRRTKITKWTKEKGKKNYLQNITQKTKDRAMRIPLKTWREPRCSGRVNSSCFTCGTSCYSCYKLGD